MARSLLRRSAPWLLLGFLVTMLLALAIYSRLSDSYVVSAVATAPPREAKSYDLAALAGLADLGGGGGRTTFEEFVFLIGSDSNVRTVLATRRHAAALAEFAQQGGLEKTLLGLEQSARASFGKPPKQIDSTDRLVGITLKQIELKKTPEGYYAVTLKGKRPEGKAALLRALIEQADRTVRQREVIAYNGRIRDLSAPTGGRATTRAARDPGLADHARVRHLRLCAVWPVVRVSICGRARPRDQAIRADLRAGFDRGRRGVGGGGGRLSDRAQFLVAPMSWLLALPLLYLLWRTLARRRIVYGHSEAFTFGYLYYVGLPLALANTPQNFGQKWLPSWQLVARMPGADGVERLIWWSIGLWLAFLLGDALARRRTLPGVDFEGPLASVLHDRAAWTIVLGSAGVALALFGIAWAIQNRALLFTGYVDLDPTSDFKGPLQAAIGFMTYLMLLAILFRKAIGQSLVALMVLVVAFLGVLTLSVGARQTFVLTLIGAIACRSVLRSGVPRATFFSLATLGGLLFGFIGNWRTASTDSPIYATLALESLFTFISLPTLTAFTKLPLFSFGIPIWGGFGNLIPTVFWPTKADFFRSLIADYHFYSPFGAINFAASALINFGWIGSLLFSVVLGFGSERLHQAAKKRPMFLATYCILVAVLSFDLWRNPLQIPIVRNLFEVGMLLPLTLVLTKNIIAKRGMSYG